MWSVWQPWNQHKCSWSSAGEFRPWQGICSDLQLGTYFARIKIRAASSSQWNTNINITSGSCAQMSSIAKTNGGFSQASRPVHILPPMTFSSVVKKKKERNLLSSHLLHLWFGNVGFTWNQSGKKVNSRNVFCHVRLLEKTTQLFR